MDGNLFKIALLTFATAWLTRTSQDFATVNRIFSLCGLLVAGVAIYNSLNGIGLVGSERVTIGHAN